MIKTIMLDTFVKTTMADVERFRADWLAQREAQGKADWPLRMTEGEWFDQFMTFLSTTAAPTSPTPAQDDSS